MGSHDCFDELNRERRIAIVDVADIYGVIDSDFFIDKLEGFLNFTPVQLLILGSEELSILEIHKSNDLLVAIVHDVASPQKIKFFLLQPALSGVKQAHQSEDPVLVVLLCHLYLQSVHYRLYVLSQDYLLFKTVAVHIIESFLLSTDVEG